MHDALHDAIRKFINTADAEHANNLALILRRIKEQNPTITPDIDELRAVVVQSLPHENEERIRYDTRT